MLEILGSKALGISWLASIQLYTKNGQFQALPKSNLVCRCDIIGKRSKLFSKFRKSNKLLSSWWIPSLVACRVLFFIFLLWHRSVRAAWLLLHTLDKMLWAKGQFFMLQHIHYFLASIFQNTNPSRLYLKILSEPHLSHKQKLYSKSQFFPKFSRPCYPSRSFFGATDPYKSTLCQTSPYESWQPTRKQLCFAQRVNFKERAKDLFSPSRMLSGSSVLFRQWSVVLFWYPEGH